MQEESGGKHGKGDENRGNTEGVAKAVDRVLMATRILSDPLLAAAVAKHAAEDDTTRRAGLRDPSVEALASRVVASLVLAGCSGLACSCPNSLHRPFLPAPAGRSPT